MNYKNWDKLVELFEFKKNISIFLLRKWDIHAMINPLKHSKKSDQDILRGSSASIKNGQDRPEFHV